MDYRHRAWNALSGKWGTVATTYFLFSIVVFVCGALGAVGIGVVLMYIIAGPAYYGLAFQSLNVMRGNKVDVNDIMAAQHRLPDAILAYFINGIFTFLWSLLFIIPGIIAAYSYSMTYYILIDNPNMSANEARLKSMKLMEGNKLRLFYLHLSFLGWLILCFLTLGILTFWIAPYMRCATAEFYQSIAPASAAAEPTAHPGSADPFDHGVDEPAAPPAPDEPFYVFEEERPRPRTGDDDTPDRIG